MESGRFVRAVLASIIGAGVWAGLARAQTCPVPVSPGPSVPYFMPQPAVPAPVPPQATPAPFIVEYHPQFQGPVWIPPDLLVDNPAPPRRHRLCCYATVNTVTCGSLKSDCTFIFGSCRAFHGDPCYPKPPKTQPYGAGGYGTGGCGCP